MHRGEERPQSDKDYVLEITIYFFSLLLPATPPFENLLNEKFFWENLKKERLGSRLNSWRTHSDAPAKPKLLLFLAQVFFLQPFGIEPKAEQHGEHSGASTGATSYLVLLPPGQWLSGRASPVKWCHPVFALIPWLLNWHWRTARGATFDPVSSWFNLTRMFQLLNPYLSK